MVAKRAMSARVLAVVLGLALSLPAAARRRPRALACQDRGHKWGNPLDLWLSSEQAALAEPHPGLWYGIWTPVAWRAAAAP
jgi:hypothetical protein